MLRTMAGLFVIVALAGAAAPRMQAAQAAVRAAFATLDALTAGAAPATQQRPATPVRWVPIGDYAVALASESGRPR